MFYISIKDYGQNVIAILINLTLGWGHKGANSII